MKKLKEMHEFNVPERWISTIVAKRKSEILNARKKRLHDPQPPDEGNKSSFNIKFNIVTFYNDTLEYSLLHISC